MATHGGVPEEEPGNEVTVTPDRKRVVRAFLLAPLAAPAAYAAALLAITLSRAVFGSHAMGSVGDLLIAVAWLGVPIAYAAMLAGGAPAYFLLRRLGVLSPWTLWLAGAVIGVVVACLIRPMLRGDLFSIPFPWWVGGLLGMVSAEAFRRISGGSSTSRD